MASEPAEPVAGTRPQSPTATMHVALWILKLSVVATVLGMIVSVFRRDGSSLNAYLFLEAGFSHAAAAQIERAAMAGLGLLAVISMVWPRGVCLLPIAAYVLLESVAGYHMRGYAFSDWTPAAHSLRYLTPLALVLVARAVRLGSPTSLQVATWLLRVGLAAVFLTHGYEALQTHPDFVDLIISSAQNLLGARIEESTARTALRVVGWTDVAVALLLLLRPWRGVLLWMLFWGLVTAVSRVTSFGWGAHTDVLVRATHFLVPLALLWIADARSRTTDAEDPATG